MHNPLPPELTQSYTIPQPTWEAELPEITMLAFGKRSARVIGERDNWTCQNSGRRFQDGWLVHIAHYHDRTETGRPDYDNPENGRVLTIEEHLREHIERFQEGLEPANAFRLIANTAYKGGLHTRRFYVTHPWVREIDRETVLQVLEWYDIDPDQILSI